MKKLKLTFKTEGKSNMEMTVDNPKDDLTLDAVKTEAASLIPVIVTRSGIPVTELVKASIISTTEEELS